MFVDKPVKKIRKDFVANIKHKSYCCDCGETNVLVLQFDHVSGEKRFNIGDAQSHTIDEIEIELKKTVIRCANCHQMISIMEKRGLDIPWKTEGLLRTIAWG